MNYLKRIIYGCDKATMTIEKKLVTGSLTFREKFELRIHFIGCSVCRLYSRQSHIINELVKQLLHSNPPANTKLDDDFKKDLQDRIEKELNKN